MVRLCLCFPGRLQTALEATIANCTGLRESEATIRQAWDVATTPSAAMAGHLHAW